MKIYICTFFIFLSLIVENEAARILAVFPFPSLSHQVVFRPLIHELIKKGHEVVFVTPNPMYPYGQLPSNLTEIDISQTIYKFWRENFVSNEQRSNYVVTQMYDIFKLKNDILDKEFKDRGIVNLVNDKNQKFDLLLAEACMRPALVFSHIFNVPAIQVSSLTGYHYNFNYMGVSTHPTLYPSITRRKLYDLSFWEKATELYNDFMARRVINMNEDSETALIKKHFGFSIPSIQELHKNVQMLFLSTNPIFEGIRPIPSSVLYMGGIHQKPEQSLPEDLKSYLDSSKNGVIYVSFGTNVDPANLPLEKIAVLVRVFSQLPYDVLWKWNNEELPGKSENIKIFNWLPQADLLRHPKIKLFVMQGGLQSTDEAITAGVPMIGIPMLADQWLNIEQNIRLKIGKRMDLETMTEEKLMNAITTIVGDYSYRQNIIKLRGLITDQPQKLLDRAIGWVEYVLRHGGAEHLQSPAAHMSWWDYLEVELVFTLLGLISAVVSLTVSVLYHLCRFIERNFIAHIKSKRI